MPAQRNAKDVAQQVNHVANGSHEENAKLLRAILAGETTVAAAPQTAAIANISNAATGTEIATAVNGILARLRATNNIAT